jgi:hypothetical protein
MSNLLKDASILLTPTAYENGRMNAIKPYKDLYGPELVTNGDFSNGSTGWTISGSASVGVNKLNVNAGAFDFFATQVALTNGLKCKVTIDAEVTSGDILLYTGTQFATISSSGSYTFYTTSDSSQIRFRSGGSGFVGSITNVSVKEDLSGDFQFSRNSAATRVNAQGLVENVQIISSELVSNGNFSQIGTEEVSNGNFSQEGSEQVTNGDFATDTKWTTNTGWTISGGSANCDGTQSGNTTLVQQGGIKGATINFVVGKTYKVNFDIVVTSGWISNIEVASGYDSNAITTSGNHTTYITAVSTNNRFTITANPDFIGSIDNVSVKEVGQDWSLGTGWSIGDDKVEADGTSAFLIQGEFQSVASVKSYKIQYEVISTNGVNIRFGGGSSMFGTPTLDTSTIGIKTIYLTSNGTVRNLQFQNNLGFIGSITNISVKEVGQDWTVADDDANNYVEFNQQEGTVRLKFLNTSPLTTLTNDTQYLGGKKYKLTVDVKEVVSGAIKIDAAGVSELFNSVGIQERIIEPTSNTYVSFYRATANVDVTLNSVSLKEITDDTDLPRINYEGFSYQDSLGSELIVNGDFATNSEWNGSKTIANGQLTKINTGLVYQSILDVSVKDYKVVVDVDTVGASLTIYLGGTQQSLSSGVNTFDMQSGGSNSFVGFNNGAGSIINSISVKEVVGQEVVPDSGCGSWLLEGQSTNLITYSSDFTQWSFKTGIGVSSNEIISVDGSLNGSKIETTAAGARYVGNNYTLSTGDNTFSVFAKKGVNNWVYLNVIKDGTNNWNYTFDLQNGLIGQSNSSAYSTTAKIEDYGNGWYRCSITANVTSAGVFTARIYCADSATDVSTIVGSNVYIYGAQLENQSYSTSYVPTSGATNTRLQDIANNSGNSTLINSTEGVLYGEISTLAELGTFRQINISKDSSNRIYVSKRANNGKLEFRMENPLGNLNFSFVQDTTTETIKFAFRYGLNNFAVFINGVNKNVTTIGNVFSVGTLNNLEFNSPLNQPFYGNVKALAVYKEALTDAQLQCLTTI